jgi:cyclohexanone monooxygenase
MPIVSSDTFPRSCAWLLPHIPPHVYLAATAIRLAHVLPQSPQSVNLEKQSTCIIITRNQDLEDLRQYPWSRDYLKQPEVLAYLQHVVTRHDLRQHMQFNTEMKAASWDEPRNLWTVLLSSGKKLTSHYIVTAIGLLSKQNYPDIPGLKSFNGEIYHTGSWPATHNFKNKKRGVIGNGSTGVQIITALADEVEELVSFQRHPQYVVPAGDKVSPEVRRDIDNR